MEIRSNFFLLLFSLNHGCILILILLILIAFGILFFSKSCFGALWKFINLFLHCFKVRVCRVQFFPLTPSTIGLQIPTLFRYSFRDFPFVFSRLTRSPFRLAQLCCLGLRNTDGWTYLHCFCFGTVSYVPVLLFTYNTFILGLNIYYGMLWVTDLYGVSTPGLL